MPEKRRPRPNASRRRAPATGTHKPANAEKSVGAVVFTEEKSREYLLLLSTFWEFPKGHGNENETEEETAHRETIEETGLEIDFVPGFREEINYFYRRGSKLFKKQVVFFLARAHTHAVRLSSEHSWFEWHPYDTALTRLTYENSRSILKKAEAFLNKSA